MAKVDVVALLSRTSDRTAGGARGARALLDALGAEDGREAVGLGEPEPPRPDGGFEEDLRDARPGLTALAEALERSFAAGSRPVLLASDCTICEASLPVVVQRVPGVRVLWLDAHADFNTPATTGSGFLGGMCLAAACGRWEDGFGPDLDPAAVVMTGVRDVDPGEAEELAAAGIAVSEPDGVPAALGDGPVYVHLDLDVLDPAFQPAQFAVPGGLDPDTVRALFERVAARGPIVGLEITAYEAPEDPDERARLTQQVCSLIAPLLAAA